MRRFLRWLFRFLYYGLARVDVEGVENIPEQGGCILATNHLSRLDPPLIYMFVKRSDFTGLIADKYQHYPLINWVVYAARGIWIHREDTDFSALRAARDYLASGGMLGIAPEGTRTKTGGLQPAKLGVAYLAAKAHVPVVPVAIHGTEGAIPKILSLRKPTMTIRFGEACNLIEINPKERTRSLQKNTDEIMCRIASMLPAKYRGVYDGHQRLKELVGAVG